MAVDGAQERAKPFRVDDRRPVADDRGFKGAAQGQCRIGGCPACRHCVAEDCADRRAQALGALAALARLDALENLQYFRRCDLGNRPRAERLARDPN